MSKPFCPLIKPEINQESIGSTNPMHGTRQKPWPPPPPLVSLFLSLTLMTDQDDNGIVAFSSLRLRLQKRNIIAGKNKGFHNISHLFPFCFALPFCFQETAWKIVEKDIVTRKCPERDILFV